MSPTSYQAALPRDVFDFKNMFLSIGTTNTVSTNKFINLSKEREFRNLTFQPVLHVPHVKDVTVV